MGAESDWPMPIIATHDVACGARLWRAGGKRRLTVVVKATFAMVPGAPMQLVAPLDVLTSDHHADEHPDRSLVAASELAPYLPRGEVLLVGHAYAPRPSPEMSVRLAVVGHRPLVDKTLYVYGERMWLDDGQVTQPVPFTRIPLRYERTGRGMPGYEENPVGMALAAGQPVPNVVDPSDPEAPASFGPIPASWPSRKRLLRGLDPSFVENAEPELPDTFAWSYFHAAPPDQRCSFFEGREWVVLDGLHPEHAHLESQLPGGRAAARIYDAESTNYTELLLNADTLWVDADRGIVCVLWRGNHEVGSDAELRRCQVFAGLELPGRPIPWPGEPQRRASSLPAPARPEQTPIPASPAARAPSASGIHAAPQASSHSSMPPAPIAHHAMHPSSMPPPATVAIPTVRYDMDATTGGAGPSAMVAQGAAAQGRESGSDRPPPAHPAPIDPAAASMTFVAPVGAPAPPMPLSPQLTPSHIEVRSASDPALQQYAQLQAQVHAQAVGHAPVAQPAPASPRRGGTLASPELGARLRSTLEFVGEPSSPDPPGSASSFGRIETMDRESITAIRPDERDAAAGGGDHAAHAAEPPPVRPEYAPVSPATVAYPQGVLPPLEPPVSSSLPLTRGISENTISAPASELARLLQAAAGATSSSDEPTAQGSTSGKTQRPEPLAPPPPRPPVETRALKTTIRGLQASRPPTTTRAPTAEIPVGAKLGALEDSVPVDESTRQLSVPTALLQAVQDPTTAGDDGGSTRIASIPAEIAAALAQSPPSIGRAPLPSSPDYGDEGPPTMTLRGRPAVISVDDMREEVERRVREGESLEGLDLSETDLSGFDLSGRKLTGTRLDRAKLAGCGLRGADLSGVSLEGANLRGAQLDDAMLERTNLVGADLTGASLVRSFLTDANLSAATVSEASFDGASGQRTVFARMRGDGARFANASLDGADFTEAQLDEADFEAALLPEARLYEASAERASFVRAVLVGARLDGAVLSGARFDGVTAEDSLWDRAALDGASLVGAKLVGASFIKASLRHADLSRADVTDARFNRAALSRARAVGTDLGVATLDGADLSGLVTEEG